MHVFLRDMLFSCLLAFVTGIVIAVASLLSWWGVRTKVDSLRVPSTGFWLAQHNGLASEAEIEPTSRRNANIASHSPTGESAIFEAMCQIPYQGNFLDC